MRPAGPRQWDQSAACAQQALRQLATAVPFTNTPTLLGSEHMRILRLQWLAPSASHFKIARARVRLDPRSVAD